MVCGHLDRNALARAVTALLAGDLTNLVAGTDPVPCPATPVTSGPTVYWASGDSTGVP